LVTATERYGGTTAATRYARTVSEVKAARRVPEAEIQEQRSIKVRAEAIKTRIEKRTLKELNKYYVIQGKQYSKDEYTLEKTNGTSVLKAKPRNISKEYADKYSPHVMTFKDGKIVSDTTYEVYSSHGSKSASPQIVKTYDTKGGYTVTGYKQGERYKTQRFAASGAFKGGEYDEQKPKGVKRDYTESESWEVMNAQQQRAYRDSQRKKGIFTAAEKAKAAKLTPEAQMAEYGGVVVKTVSKPKKKYVISTTPGAYTVIGEGLARKLQREPIIVPDKKITPVSKQYLPVGAAAILSFQKELKEAKKDLTPQEGSIIDRANKAIRESKVIGLNILGTKKYSIEEVFGTAAGGLRFGQEEVDKLIKKLEDKKGFEPGTAGGQVVGLLRATSFSLSAGVGIEEQIVEKPLLLPTLYLGGAAVSSVVGTVAALVPKAIPIMNLIGTAAGISFVGGTALETSKLEGAERAELIGKRGIQFATFIAGAKAGVSPIESVQRGEFSGKQVTIIKTKWGKELKVRGFETLSRTGQVILISGGKPTSGFDISKAVVKTGTGIVKVTPTPILKAAAVLGRPITVKDEPTKTIPEDKITIIKKEPEIIKKDKGQVLVQTIRKKPSFVGLDLGGARFGGLTTTEGTPTLAEGMFKPLTKKKKIFLFEYPATGEIVYLEEAAGTPLEQRTRLTSLQERLIKYAQGQRVFETQLQTQRPITDLSGISGQTFLQQQKIGQKLTKGQIISQRPISILGQKLSAISISGLTQAQQLIQKQGILTQQKLSQVQIQTVAQTQAQIQAQAQAQAVAQAQAEAQALAVTQAQAVAQQQVLQQELLTTPKSVGVLGFEFIKGVRKPTAKGLTQKGYHAYVKRKQLKKGKGSYESRGYEKVTKKALTKAGATVKAMEILDRYSNRSGYIKRAKQNAQARYKDYLLESLRKKFRTQKKNPNIFVEKTAHAIDSYQEKNEISYESMRLRKTKAILLGRIKTAKKKQAVDTLSKIKKTKSNKFIKTKKKKAKKIKFL